MQNTTKVHPQSQVNDSLASKNNPTSNQPSSAQKGNGSLSSNIFSRNVVNRSQGNFTTASTTQSPAIPTMAQILSNTVDDKSSNINPGNSFGFAPSNTSRPIRSNPFIGTINQSQNSSNVLDIFNKNSNTDVPNNTSNTSSNPFVAAQRSQNSSNMFSNSQLAPTFNQVSSNFTTNNTNFQVNQSPPANLNEIVNKNNNSPIFPPPNQQATGYFPNNTFNTSPSVLNSASFVQTSFQPNTQQMLQTMAITQPSPTSSSLFNFFNTKLMLCHLQQKIGTYCDSRLDAIDAAQGQRQVSYDSYMYEFLSSVIQIKTTSDSLTRLKEEMDDLEQRTESLMAKLKTKLEAKKDNGLADKLKWRKLLEDIEEELTLIESQLHDFIKPLYIAHQSGTPIYFEDPNVFSIKVASSIHKKMVKLQASITELSSQALQSAELILNLEESNSKEAHTVIAQLTQYFEQICIKFELLKEHYIAQQQLLSNQRFRQGQAIEGREKCEFLRVENYMRTISKVVLGRTEAIQRRFSKGSEIPSKP